MAIIIEQVVFVLVDEVPELLRPAAVEIVLIIEPRVDDRDADMVAGRLDVIRAEDFEERVSRRGRVGGVPEAPDRRVGRNALDVLIGGEGS